MKHIYIFIAAILFAVAASAQMSIEEVNYKLETRPYFKLGFKYDVDITLPDSVQEKFAKALNREIPEKVLDSMLAFTPSQKERVLQDIEQKCKGDSTCTQEQYREYIKDERARYTKMYANDIMPTILILTAANWQVKKAIPVLKKAIGDKAYDQPSVLMALAKLGDDSIKQLLLKKYTLSYTIKNTQDDTINDNVILYDLPTKSWSATEGIDVAMYLQSKEMLLNILELIYIRGISGFCIGEDCYDYPYVSFLVNEFSDYNYFNKFPNYEKLYKTCNDYSTAIRDLYRKKRNRKERKELDTLLSTAYRTKVKEQLREWVIENVNFE